MSMFFDPRRYDLAKVGRYKFNKKLALKNRISGQKAAETVVSPLTGEVLVEEGQLITRELAEAIQNAAVRRPHGYDGCPDGRYRLRYRCRTPDACYS